MIYHALNRANFRSHLFRKNCSADGQDPWTLSVVVIEFVIPKKGCRNDLDPNGSPGVFISANTRFAMFGSVGQYGPFSPAIVIVEK